MGDGIILSSFLCSVLFCVTFFKFSRNITPQEGCKEGAGAWYPRIWIAVNVKSCDWRSVGVILSLVIQSLDNYK